MEEEAAGGGGGTGGRAVAGGEDGWDCEWLDAAAPDVEHGSDEVADHVVEEAAASDAVDEDVSCFGLALFPGGGKNGTDGGLRDQGPTLRG